jgi:hypothetical protein
MFRRSKIEAVKGRAASASAVAVQLAQDKKFRKQVISAASHGSAAARRTRRSLGLLGAATRLATDEKLTAELKRAGADLRRAYGRLGARKPKKQSHKLRNSLMLAAAASLAAVPKIRAAVTSALEKRRTSPRSLDDLTKEELDERAHRADIPGRTEMTKDELVAALRRQG